MIITFITNNTIKMLGKSIGVYEYIHSISLPVSKHCLNGLFDKRVLNTVITKLQIPSKQ